MSSIMASVPEEDMEREQLESQIELLTKQNEKIETENTMFKKFVEKKLLELGDQSEDNKRKRKSKRNIPINLTIDQKAEISTIVHDDLVNEIEMEKKNSEKMLDTLRAVIEEAEVKISELKRDIFEFNRDVVFGGVGADYLNITNKDNSKKDNTVVANTNQNKDSSNSKSISERFERFYSEKMTQMEASIEKLKLKNVTLKTQISKIEQQLSSKEDVGDTLHYIDFHQLQIENKQNIVKVNEKNEELVNLKQSVAKIIQTLNTCKNQLKEQTEESIFLMNEITTKEKILEKLKQEKIRSKKNIRIQNNNLKKLQSILSESTVSVKELPNISEYIKQKKTMYELEELIKNEKRKLEIRQLGLHKKRKNKNYFPNKTILKPL